jgi:hypothetical protein
MELAVFVGCLGIIKYAVLQGAQHPKESLAAYAWSILVAVVMMVAIEGIGYLRKQGDTP